MTPAELAALRERIRMGRRKIARVRAEGFDVTTWETRLLALQKAYEEEMDRVVGFGRVERTDAQDERRAA